LESGTPQVDPKPVEINGIRGVTYGEYNNKRSWIDWWLKTGELMICINLQSYSLATEADKNLHQKVINSLRYIAK
jgi:hypothetical protein